MPDDRTTVTELATALGTTGYETIEEAAAERPGALDIGSESWERLDRILANEQVRPLWRWRHSGTGRSSPAMLPGSTVGRRG